MTNTQSTQILASNLKAGKEFLFSGTWLTADHVYIDGYEIVIASGQSEYFYGLATVITTR